MSVKKPVFIAPEDTGVPSEKKLSLKEQKEQLRERERARQYSDVSDQARKKAEALYKKGKFLCSEAVFTVVNDHLGQPADSRMVKMASGFPVGIGHSGCICGALAGGVMALGLANGREKPGEKMSDDMFPLSAELHDRFIRRNKYVCCRKLIRHVEFGSSEHIKQCIKFTGEMAADVIDLLENGTEGNISPESGCNDCPKEYGFRIRNQKKSRLGKIKSYFSSLADRLVA